MDDRMAAFTPAQISSTQLRHCDQRVPRARHPGVLRRLRSRAALVPLEQVANRVRPVSDEFIAPSGIDVTGVYVDYARPLLGGELPRYARLRNTPMPQVPASSTQGGA